MDWLAWLSLAGICALGAMSPGPSLLIVLRSAASGPRQGFACALAHGAAIAVYAGLTAFGLAVLITRSPLLFTALQWAGAAMLIYLGWKALRAPAPNPAAGAIPAPQQPTARSALQGFGVAFFNPKVALFFTALFSQFVTEQQALTTKLGMAAMAAGIDAGWYCLITLAVLAGRNRNWVGNSLGHRLQQLFGVLLLGLAARLVLTL
ncbi:LysE family translocator [Microbulbifer rhizosphaerae]|uniref:Threonine/homoserine/homoserine lactone efflux protein n=1 Tax=Microbulbifer rhizosphaerae TaxID=1562603 RepID=A0A7W4WFU8_9GAMM|nr:LysE family translocator [Microbulbifer rhizosphaerae]MBB3063436.1 threonine/homoserine/homoserine lactone efflux protein [Microbulbifer rhizosphaerae]